MRIRFSSLLASLAIISLTCYSLTSFAAFPIHSYQANFELIHNGKRIGASHKVFQTDGKQYSFSGTTNIHVFLLSKRMSESSQGAVNDSGIQPTRYVAKENGKTTLDANNIPQNTQDNLSQALMMRFNMLKNGKPGTMPVITQHGNDQFKFSIAKQNVMIPTKLGKLNTTVVSFSDSQGNTVNQWLAKKYDYLPVYITISKKGKVSDIISISDFKS